MSENIYFHCRKEAARHNDRLSSRGGAAEALGVSESTLAHYELGLTKNVPVDMVVMMAEVYNAPNLRNAYCKNECPIGRTMALATGQATLEETTVHLLGSIAPRQLESCAQSLLRIAQDGEITDQELEELGPILETLDRISKATSELHILVERRRRHGT